MTQNETKNEIRPEIPLSGRIFWRGKSRHILSAGTPGREKLRKNPENRKDARRKRRKSLPKTDDRLPLP